MKRDHKERGNWRERCVCVECQEPVNPDFPVRSNTWAFGMAGVRMMLCSVQCRDSYDQHQEVTT